MQKCSACGSNNVVLHSCRNRKVQTLHGKVVEPYKIWRCKDCYHYTRPPSDLTPPKHHYSYDVIEEAKRAYEEYGKIAAVQAHLRAFQVFPRDSTIREWVL